MKTTITYTGQVNENEVNKFCKKHSKGCYLFVSVLWNSVRIVKTDKILSSKTAPSDYRFGFWKNGVQTDWSEARKITDQNTGVIQK